MLHSAGISSRRAGSTRRHSTRIRGWQAAGPRPDIVFMKKAEDITRLSSMYLLEMAWPGRESGLPVALVDELHGGDGSGGVGAGGSAGADGLGEGFKLIGI